MKTQAIVIHGGETFDSHERYLAFLRSYRFDPEDLRKKGWKDSLQARLGPGFEVMAPRMPNSWDAKYLEWKIFFDKIVPFIEDGAALIGNSLGAIFLAKYLSENTVPGRLGGIFLIAAPYEPTDDDDSLADFILPGDMSRLAAYGGRVRLYFSKDDPIVPFSHMAKYMEHLPEARASALDGRGHFMTEEFPELIADLRVMV